MANDLLFSVLRDMPSESLTALKPLISELIALAQQRGNLEDRVAQFIMRGLLPAVQVLGSIPMRCGSTHELQSFDSR